MTPWNEKWVNGGISLNHKNSIQGKQPLSFMGDRLIFALIYPEDGQETAYDEVYYNINCDLNYYLNDYLYHI